MDKTRYIKLTLQFYPEADGRWTGECVELGTATFGSTLPEVYEELNKLISEYLCFLEAQGEKDRILRESGVAVVALEGWAPPASVQIGSDTGEIRTHCIVPGYFPVERAAITN